MELGILGVGVEQSIPSYSFFVLISKEMREGKRVAGTGFKDAPLLTGC